MPKRQRTAVRCYDAVMRRTTIGLPEDLADLLADEARQRGTSVSRLVRDLIARGLGGRRREIPWAGVIDDAGMTPGAGVEEALEEGWEDDLHRDRG